MHKTTKGLLVLGLWFETGNENPFLARFIFDLPEEAGGHFGSTLAVNVHELLPAGLAYYTYSGSLTTPPCSESVTWLMLKNPVSLSSIQLQRFVSIIGKNNRPLQPLRGRQVRASI